MTLIKWYPSPLLSVNVWLKLTSDGANPASPANVSKGMAVALLGVVDCDLGEVLERTCRTPNLTLNSQTHR